MAIFDSQGYVMLSPNKNHSSSIFFLVQILLILIILFGVFILFRPFRKYA